MGVTHSTIIKTDNYARIMATAKALNGGFVKVGFPEKAEPAGWLRALKTGAKPYENMSEVARIAVWNEYGVPNKAAVAAGAMRGFMSYWRIPPRPFFRTAIDGSARELAVFIKRVESMALRGKITVKQALETLGLWDQAKIRESIRNTTTPPNADATIAAKGSSHPLIDTGQMLLSVSFVTSLAGSP